MDFWDEADGTRVYLVDLDEGTQEAARHWQAHPGRGEALLGLRVDAGDTRTAELALAAGYRIRFTVVDLARDTAGAGDPPVPEGVEVRRATADDLRPLQRLLEASFDYSGTGQEARDFAKLDLDLDLTLIAYNGDGIAYNGDGIAYNGDGIAGMISSEHEDGGSVDSSWVAVAAHWRRRGIARLLLQRNLRMLAERGITRATIRTVRENPYGTVPLYESAGYVVTARYPRWAKPFTPPGTSPGS